MDIFNELKEQLSSCPERTRALCRTVWGAVSTSLSTALTAASIEAGDDRDDGGGGGGRGGGGGGSAAVGGWCTTLTSTTAAAATARGANGSGAAAAAAAGSTGGRFATIMGAVKSRSISNADVERDDMHMQPHNNSSSHSMMRNGHHHSATGGGTLQKQDLRYDIGSSSQYHHVRQPSVRSRSQQPMPTTDELDRRFAKVLVSSQNIINILDICIPSILLCCITPSIYFDSNSVSPSLSLSVSLSLYPALAQCM